MPPQALGPPFVQIPQNPESPPHPSFESPPPDRIIVEFGGITFFFVNYMPPSCQLQSLYPLPPCPPLPVHLSLSEESPGAPHLLNLDKFHYSFKNQFDIEDTLFAATTASAPATAATNATELYFSSEEVDEQLLT